MLDGGWMYNDTGILMQQYCPISTLFFVQSIMSTSRRGRHVESLPPEQVAPAVVDDVDGSEGDVTPLHDNEDADLLASVVIVSPPCHAPTTNTGKNLSACVCILDMD